MNRPKRVQFLGRPPVKSTKACAMAKRKGELEAETKFYDKQPLTKKLKRLLWKKIEEVDPIEVAALLAGTYLVKQVIEASEEITAIVIAKASYIKNNPKIGGAWALSGIIAGPLGGVISTVLMPEDPIAKETYLKAMDTVTVEGIEWVLSFVIAYLLVKHGGEIIGMLTDGGKNIGNIAKIMLAA